MDKKRTASASEKQKARMLQFLKQNTKLISGKFSSNFTMKTAENKWKELAEILNCIPGANKDWKSWRKTWQDMRSRTKVKCAKNNRERNATGGGPLNEESLTNTEEQIFEIIKAVSVEGHSTVKESLVGNVNDQLSENCIVIQQDDTVVLPLENDVLNDSEVDKTKEVLPTLVPALKKHTLKKNINANESQSFTSFAVENFKQYREEKIQILKRIAAAKEKSADAKGRIAEALEKIAKSYG